jgi:ribosomal protein S18 acetylase RimI-like enzyme
MTATTFAAMAGTPGHMRPLNVFRDLPAVADLIELCFSSTMDPEGRSYVDQMRRNGRDSNFLGWASKVIDSTSLPLSGFVWEDAGRIVGNVSLIPFIRGSQRIYLIANVATHPDFRRRGIARILTDAATQRAREKHATSIWLHVREENSGAVKLYRDLGFVERARRTSWSAPSGTTPLGNLRAPVQILVRPARDWFTQEKWLERAYPTALHWYNQQSWDMFQPGLFSSIYRFFADINTLQWSAYRHGILQGILSCHKTGGRADALWAAFPEHPDAEAFTALLLYGRRMLSQSRGLLLDYPAGAADEAIRAAGFFPHRTLIWMEAAGATF